MRKGISIVVLAVLTVTLARLGWDRYGTTSARAAVLKGAYPTEGHWLAAETAQDIAEMAIYAAQQRVPLPSLGFGISGFDPANPGEATVSFSQGPLRGLTQKLTFVHHIWAPEDYEGLARAVLAKLKLTGRAGGPPDDEALLTALLKPMPRVIESQNERVSSSLARSGMLEARNHEDAALILGALALREASGWFWDQRQLLCRMAAHLAMARALRSGEPYGLSGQYAAVVLESVALRQTNALERLKGLDTAGISATRAAWTRSLRLGITGDWREMTRPEEATLREQLEYFRVRKWLLGGAAAVQWVGGLDREAQSVSDWARMAMEGHSGIECSPFAENAVAPETKEANEIWARAEGGSLATTGLVEALNRPAERCLTKKGPQVLGWGTWAAFLQRHLCHQLLEADSCWRHILAISDTANAAIVQFDSNFGGLTLYPFLQAKRWQHRGIELDTFVPSLRNGVATASKTPEIVNVPLWAALQVATSYAVIRERAPPLLTWFREPIPLGTAYDNGDRLDDVGLKPGGVTLEQLHERAPYAYGYAERLLDAIPQSAETVEKIRATFGPRAEYDMRVLNRMALATTGEENIRIKQHECDLLADRCIWLGNTLAEQHKDEAAARAFRRAFESAVDRVRVANSSRFLVAYDFQHNLKDEATRVAEDGAEVYSAGGLKTMGELLEWEERFDEAEEYFRTVERRYHRTEGLLGFYYRMAVVRKDSHYEFAFNELVRKAFPAGLEPLDTKLLPPVPKDGVQIAASGGRIEWLGVRPGDIVVGFDGWRVHNVNQYNAIQNFSRELDFRLNIYEWQKHEYVEISPRLVDRDIGVSLRNYP